MIRLGVIGLSPGNGHPYSWSAIFNGYDERAMARCPFPAIPQYLAQRRFPDDAIAGAAVTHVWTQDAALSRDIAAAARIANVATRLDDFLGAVDAVLLARDDAENHEGLAARFLDAGLPVYIDKPFALSLGAAERLLALARKPSQIFTCTALAFAAELQPTAEALAGIGAIRRIDGRTPKAWDTYAVHVIEPILMITAGMPGWSSSAGTAGRGIRHARCTELEGCGRRLEVEWENGLATTFVATGEAKGDIAIEIVGDAGSLTLTFRDSFTAFRAALQRFIDIVAGRALPFPREHVMQVVTLIEKGRS